jgi:hypothetical protein
MPAAFPQSFSVKLQLVAVYSEEVMTYMSHHVGGPLRLTVDDSELPWSSKWEYRDVPRSRDFLASQTTQAHAVSFVSRSGGKHVNSGCPAESDCIQRRFHSRCLEHSYLYAGA